MAAQVPGGWPEIMASNRALALGGRDRLVTASGNRDAGPALLLAEMTWLESLI